jgi:hypothetical protein
MTSRELEKQFLPLAIVRNSLILFEAAVAVQIVRRSFEEHLRFLGVEAFRIWDDGRVQPGLEFSNVSFGYVAERDGKLQIESFGRQPRSDQKAETACEDTLQLIAEGAKSGYGWFEVSIEDPITQELLFFREFDRKEER